MRLHARIVTRYRVLDTSLRLDYAMRIEATIPLQTSEDFAGAFLVRVIPADVIDTLEKKQAGGTESEDSDRRRHWVVC